MVISFITGLFIGAIIGVFAMGIFIGGKDEN